MVFYKKNKNNNLLRELETVLDISNAQNYIPIYTRFFSLNSTNWNSINLKNENELAHVHSCDYNKALATLQNDTPIEVFFKYSPLLDPSKYLNGKYSDYTFTLPSLNETLPKLMDVNNSAYVDSFFSYLSSELFHKNKFVHGIQFYGSYLGIKNNFKYNIEDEIEQLHNSTFFYEHNNKLFTLSKELPTGTSQKNREKLILDDEPISIVIENIDAISKPISSNVSDLELVEELNIEHIPSNDVEVEVELEVDDDSSSQSSNTHSDHTEDMEDEDIESEESYSFDLVASIHQFPVQIIALEKCEDTLDSLLMNSISTEELTSALFQVIITLVVYQNTYQFTHNDLHTNNIMFVSTPEPYLYYMYNNVHYKVPTYGRIFKIIDFGRAIYTYDGKRFVSDSFSMDGDAATQYNIEPYFNSSKPVLEPNYSFDLCRLACSMLDIIPDDTPIYELVEEWCLDDKNRNVLYKKNGEERYPEFKLYKMISRTVHNHIPELQLSKPIFKSYITKELHTNSMIILK
jgi:hypothetical protein